MSLTTYHSKLQEHAIFKRFNERWVADPDFRKALNEDKAGTLAGYGIDCSPADVQSLFEADVSQPSKAMRAMWQIVVTKTNWVNEFYKKQALPSDLRIYSWRERQIARQLLELGPFHTKSNLHASLSIELTKGCSVGCWFCALSPERLSGIFEYSSANQVLWNDVLLVLHQYLGTGVQSGFLYWATDPLDNPDYEQLCLDFYKITGVFPPTTTAQALKDPTRTRALLQMSQERGCWLNRFSILSIKMLNQVHAEFSAEELAQVECLSLNRESAFAFGNAGKFRERANKEPELLQKQRKNLLWAPWYTGDPAYANTEEYPLASIGCVTGFLLNMCDRTVQLISPAAASDRWPLGYYIHAQGTFNDGAELAALLNRMIEEQMSPFLRPSDRLCFHDWLQFEELETGFRLNGRFHQSTTFQGQERYSQWREIGDLVHRGGKTVAEISEIVSVKCNVNPEVVQSMLNELLRAGVLDEINN